MCELNSGRPCSAKCFSPTSSRPSTQPSLSLAQWSVCRITRAPYAAASVLTCAAPASEPRIDARSPPPIPFPAMNAEPLWENWMITGEFTRRGRLHHAVHRVGAGAVGRREGEPPRFGQGEHVLDVGPGEHTGIELGADLGHASERTQPSRRLIQRPLHLLRAARRDDAVGDDLGPALRGVAGAEEAPADGADDDHLCPGGEVGRPRPAGRTRPPAPTACRRRREWSGRVAATCCPTAGRGPAARRPTCRAARPGCVRSS